MAPLVGCDSPESFPLRPIMERHLRLRRWQRVALDHLRAGTSADFLAVATPGAGKTTFAVAAAIDHLRKDRRAPIVVVAPTAHLKRQWTQAAARLGVQLSPGWSASDGRFPWDLHGVVVTYQQVAANPEALRAQTAGAFVVLDELHHAGAERAWGDAVRLAFEPAARRLALSGTPFRSDTNAIPFVNYQIETAVPDYEYGYADALRDGGVVRPVYFPRINGFMEWVAPDGSLQAASFDDPLDRARSQQRLRTALSVDGEWLPAVLAQAHERLVAIRARQPDAGGLVIATDQDHARDIARLLRDRLQVRSIVALSDDPDASDRIAAFSDGTEPWIVAVRMVSEGVDIPRLCVGVFATTTGTELFFRQAVGRLVRYRAGHGRQKAYLFVPDDPRLRSYAYGIAEQRRHSLRSRADDGSGDDRPEPDPAEFDRQVQGSDEQLSLFSALSSVVSDGPHPVQGPIGPDGSVFSDDYDEAAHDDGTPHLSPEEPDLVLDLTEVRSMLAVGGPGGSGPPPEGSLFDHKQDLRTRNAELARDLARRTGLTHAQINTELNRLAGVRRIGEATAVQLERRMGLGERWMERLRSEALRAR